MQLASLQLPSAPTRSPRRQESAPQAGPTGRQRLRNTSPDEEYERRLQAYADQDGNSPVEAIPDALVGLLLDGDIRTVKVTRNGIAFQHMGQSYEYWHENSTTCQPGNLGEKVTFHWDACDPYAVHVFDQGKYIESVPLKGKPGWFTAEAQEEILRHRKYIDHVAGHLKSIHGTTSREKADRARDNREALQAVVDLPAPDGGAPEPAVDRYDSLTRSSDGIQSSRRSRDEEQARRRRLAEDDCEEDLDIRDLSPAQSRHPNPFDEDLRELEDTEDETALDIAALAPRRPRPR